MPVSMRDSRRAFLRFLASSPAFAARGADQVDDVITDLKDALNVLDLEPAARKALPPAHYGYMASGVDDDVTLRVNREAFNRITLRPRRLVDVRKIDLSVELFGRTWPTPIILAPCGHQKAFHPEGEVAVASAAKQTGTLQILSTMTSSPIEEVAAAAGNPLWYQLYASSRWEVTQKVVERAEAAGCTVMALTVDRPAGRNSETQKRLTRLDRRQCTACHQPGSAMSRRPMFRGIDMTGVTSSSNPGMDWAYVRKLKSATKMKLILKGLEVREDAVLAVENGVDGIVVSNHGARAEDSGRATIDSLAEVAEAVGGRIPILVDGGFRRGTDIFKALALGAKAVCVGRPYLWGLSAFGQPGVERAIGILRAELELIMKQCGTPTIAQITRSSIEMKGGRA